jgi:hypothetical protein
MAMKLNTCMFWGFTGLHVVKFYKRECFVLKYCQRSANTTQNWVQVKRVPCHHGMARPQVPDEGDDLQIWRVAAIKLNKQSRTAEKGWLVVGLTPHRKKPRTWTDPLDKPSKQTEMTIRFWYVECKKSVQGRFAYGSCERNIKIEVKI